MAFENNEAANKIGGIIIRLACGLIGIVGIVAVAAGFISWLRDSSQYASVWSAIVGDEPYCRLVCGSIRMGGGLLWEKTPNGMLPALCVLSLYGFSLGAAIFNRMWIYCIVAFLTGLSVI